MWRNDIGMFGFEAEERSAILKDNTRFAGHQPRTERLERLLMKETAFLSLSTTVRYTVSPFSGRPGFGEGMA